MKRRVNYKMQQPNVVNDSGIVETGTDEIEFHSSHRTSPCEQLE